MSPTRANQFRVSPIGETYEDDHVVVFFGNRLSDRSSVETSFPSLKVIAVKQTHSNIVVASPFNDPPPEADAHYTHQKGLALSIRTADCVPVLIHDPESQVVVAIHAGWRGIKNEVILKATNAIAPLSSRARAWVGPHIGTASFEVGHDVADRLEMRFKAVRSAEDPMTSLHPHPDVTKARVDLHLIAHAQLRFSGITPDRIFEIMTDTFVSTDHESFRRDREKAGRQISFIALKP